MMDLADINGRITTAITEVQDLINKTEDLYSNIYVQLPVVENNVEATISEMNLLLDFFLSSSTSTRKSYQSSNEKKEAKKISLVLKEIENNFIRSTSNMIGEKEIKRALSVFLGKDASVEKDFGIKNILKMINDLKKRISDIEIVSCSAHLGTQVKASRVIYDNIMSLSDFVDKEYDLVLGNAKDLQAWNRTFIDNLNKLLLQNNKLTGKQAEELLKLFEVFFHSLERISYVLKDLIDNVENTVSPVQELMGSIQKQDIIRQSLENLNKCLSSVLENVSKVGRDSQGHITILNYYSFVKQVIKLSVNLIDNIKKGILKSLQELREPLDTIRERIMELQEEGSLITDFLSGKGSSSGKNTIQEIFAKVKSFIDSFSLNLKSLQAEVGSFSIQNDEFHNNVNIITKTTSDINNRVEYLNKLKLLTRIELTRFQIEDSSFDHEIETIFEQVIRAVHINDSFIFELQENLKKDLSSFEEVLSANKYKIGEMLEIVTDSGEKVAFIEELVSQAINALGEAAVLLMETVDGIAEEIDLGENLPQVLDKVRDNLLNLHKDIDEQKRDIMAVAGISVSVETSPELKQVLLNFTTYLERLTANHIFDDVDMDIGGEEGELTLF